eukprot:GHVU01197532.1.p1 GENE.GHVU01197532.1~~GHVU01197532.1.p1  ORF type:complete len:142 (+),score=11.96 GHVU01197532.1:531-956(+)
MMMMICKISSARSSRGCLFDYFNFPQLAGIRQCASVAHACMLLPVQRQPQRQGVRVGSRGGRVVEAEESSRWRSRRGGGVVEVDFVLRRYLFGSSRPLSFSLAATIRVDDGDAANGGGGVCGCVRAVIGAPRGLQSVCASV